MLYAGYRNTLVDGGGWESTPHGKMLSGSFNALLKHSIFSSRYEGLDLSSLGKQIKMQSQDKMLSDRIATGSHA